MPKLQTTNAVYFINSFLQKLKIRICDAEYKAA